MEVVLGNILIRQEPPLEKGQKVEGHTHNFDHVTYINKGKAKISRVSPDGEYAERVISADDEYNYVLILKHHIHTIEAIEDNTMYHCVYSHRDPNTGEVVMEYNGWTDAYQ